jgi:hypothetical protein
MGAMHNHTHGCKHEHIKFCGQCQRPYCEDCGREWFDECKLNHYWTWYQPTYVPSPSPKPWEPIITCETNNTDPTHTVHVHLLPEYVGD